MSIFKTAVVIDGTTKKAKTVTASTIINLTRDLEKPLNQPNTKPRMMQTKNKLTMAVGIKPAFIKIPSLYMII